MVDLSFFLTSENRHRRRREGLSWMKKSLRLLWTRSRQRQRLRSCSGSSPFSCSLCVGRSVGTWTLIPDSSSVISSKSWRLALTNNTKGWHKSSLDMNEDDEFSVSMFMWFDLHGFDSLICQAVTQHNSNQRTNEISDLIGWFLVSFNLDNVKWSKCWLAYELLVQNTSTYVKSAHWAKQSINIVFDLIQTQRSKAAKELPVSWKGSDLWLLLWQINLWYLASMGERSVYRGDPSQRQGESGKSFWKFLVHTLYLKDLVFLSMFLPRLTSLSVLIWFLDVFYLWKHYFYRWSLHLIEMLHYLV